MKKFIGRFAVALIAAFVVTFFFGQFILDSLIGVCIFAAVIAAVLTTVFAWHREEIDALEARVKALEARLEEKEAE